MRALIGLWRRSIQVRVVVSTLVLSAIVIALTGYAVLARVSDGLVDERRASAVAEARTGFQAAQAQFDAAVTADASTQAQTLNQLVTSLSGAPDAPRRHQVVLEGPLPRGGGQPPVRSSSAVDLSAISAGLRRDVDRTSEVHWQYSSLRGDEADEPAVVVGQRLRSPADGETYQMFYVFSLRDQDETLGLVTRALVVGGLVMVVLLGAVAWLVSRQIVNPVRLARRIAERFAAGSLEQRMHVRGEDDLARLSTSFNQMAGSLQSQIRRLEDLSRLQQRFVSDVSHELRTPLTTVQMASGVLHEARHRFDPQSARSAELLKRELDRFQDLLSNLLDLSRFDAGAAQLELGPVDLAQVARTASRNATVDQSGVRVHVLGAESPAVVEADDRRVDRIVRNLLVNAVRYSGSDVLEVEVGQSADRVSLVVRDYGVGLSSEDAQRVFDRFWRADPARTQGGTGLGLAIAREDAALHGGSLRAWGRTGGGAEFVLTLPRQVRRDGAVLIEPVVRRVFA